MSLVRRSFQDYLKNSLTATELIYKLKDFVFSVNSVDRNEAVDAMGNLPTEEATRELISLYQECNWFTTKVRILRNLGIHSNSRGMEFCLQVIRGNDPTELKRGALEGLVLSAHPFGYHFLKNQLHEGVVKERFTSLAELKALFGLRSAPKEVILSDLEAMVQLGFPADAMHELSRQDHPQLEAFISQIIDFKSLSREHIYHLLKALQWRSGHAAMAILKDLEAKCSKEPGGVLHEQWLQCCALVTLEPTQTFEELFSRFQSASSSLKTKLINAFSWSILKLSVPCEEHDKAEEYFLSAAKLEKNENVLGRWIRFAGQNGFQSESTLSFVLEQFNNPTLLSSLLYFAERIKSSKLTDQILNVIKTLDSQSEHWAQVFRSLANQEPIPVSLDTKAMEVFLKRSVNKNASTETLLAVLQFIGQNPRFHFLDKKDHFLMVSDRFRLPLIVSFKNVPHLPMHLLNLLADCLKSENDSVVGRALDVLTLQRASQAVETVLDFLENRLDNLELVEKISRSLPVADDRQGLFLQRVKALLVKAENTPSHPYISQLLNRLDKETSVDKIA